MNEPRIASITNRLVKLVTEDYVGFAPTDLNVTGDTKLKNLELDSLDNLELLMGVEDEFNIEITDDVAEEFGSNDDATIEDLAVLVDQLLGE